MAQRGPWEVDDELWALIEPLLPRVERRYRYPGRKRLDDRKALCGILFVLYTGIPWEFLPQELGYGSGDPPGQRLPRHSARLRAGCLPVRRRAGHRPAALVLPPAHPLGNPRRHPRSLPHHRLRHHLLAPAQDPLIVLGPLKPNCAQLSWPQL